MVGRHGSEAIRDTTFLRNSRSSTLASEGSFLVALANACRMFARLTMPTSLPPSTMGTRLIRLRSSKPAISPSGVSGLAVTTLRVITSATLPEWDLMYLLADAHPVDISSRSFCDLGAGGEDDCRTHRQAHRLDDRRPETCSRSISVPQQMEQPGIAEVEVNQKPPKVRG